MAYEETSEQERVEHAIAVLALEAGEIDIPNEDLVRVRDLRIRFGDVPNRACVRVWLEPATIEAAGGPSVEGSKP